MGNYPITLVKLANAIVVGGGAVAERKVAGLLGADASVTVIAPELTPTLEDWHTQGHLQVRRRNFQTDDLADAQLVIAATDDPAVNHAVSRQAIARGCLVNVVDDPAHCTFHVPAIVRRGAVTIAISTDGASPALARRLREEIESLIGPEYATLAGWLAELRPRVQAKVPQAKRAELWNELIDTALSLLRENREAEARASIQTIVARNET